MSGGRFPKGGAMKISLSFILRVSLWLCVWEWKSSYHWRLLSVYFLPYSISSSVYPNSFKKEQRYPCWIWINQRSHLQLETSGVDWTHTEGRDAYGWLTDDFLTENWQSQLGSRLNSYAVTLIMPQFAWQTTAGDRLSLKESVVKLRWRCLLFFRKNTLTIYSWLEDT